MMNLQPFRACPHSVQSARSRPALPAGGNAVRVVLALDGGSHWRHPVKNEKASFCRERTPRHHARCSEDEERRRRRQHNRRKRMLLIILWAIHRKNDRFADFTGVYRLIGQLDPRLENKEYMALFRMPKCRVRDLHRLLADRLACQDTRLRKAVSSEKRLAMTLHWLSTGMRFKDLGDVWAVGKSTAHKIVHQVVKVMAEVLVPMSIVFPTGEELRRVINDFESLCGLPQCGGAIDGTTIQIQRPSGKIGYKYWCFKGMDAILLLATVDARGIFTSVTGGNAGSVGDASIYGSSPLKQYIDAGIWFPESCSQVVSDVVVRPFLVGDAAFPFSATMMKGYTGNPQAGTDEHAYNYAHVRTRRIVENAFGILKGRFQILKTTWLNDPIFMRHVSFLCCALHNMCQRNINNDPWENDWFPIIDVAAPVEDVQIAAGANDNEFGPPELTATNVRAALATYGREHGGF